MKKLLFLIYLSFFAHLAFSQVGVNTQNPHKLTDLDVQNIVSGQDTIPKGIMIPRMSEAKRNSIDVSAANNPNSLMIYNTDEDCYNYYSKKDAEWKSLCGKLGKSTFTYNCNAIQVEGSYIIGKELTTANFLRLNVTVTKPGEYNLAAMSPNGYSFTASGQFLVAGNYTVTMLGMGKPIASGINQLTLINNGAASSCQVPITVLPEVGMYILACDKEYIKGVYEVGKPLDATHKIDIEVDVQFPGSWEVHSDVVEGVSFSGHGTFTDYGTATITLYGKGMPANTKTKQLTLTTNTLDEQQVFCKILLPITIPQKTILSCGVGVYAVNGPATGISRLFTNPLNFGAKEESIFKTYTPDFKPTATTSLSGLLNVARLQPYLAPSNGDKPVDIVVMTYDGGLLDNAAGDLMADYVRQGGVLIFCNEYMVAAGNQRFMTNLFGTGATITDNGVVGAGYILKLPTAKASDMILNGPFGDIRNLYIGEDSGGSDAFTAFPTSEMEWAVMATNYSPATLTASANIFALKAKRYNLFFIGDGGAFAYDGGTSNATRPVALGPAPNYNPIPKPNYGSSTNKFSVVNSILGANLFAWAIMTAEVSGINTK